MKDCIKVKVPVPEKGMQICYLERKGNSYHPIESKDMPGKYKDMILGRGVQESKVFPGCVLVGDHVCEVESQFDKWPC